MIIRGSPLSPSPPRTWHMDSRSRISSSTNLENGSFTFKTCIDVSDTFFMIIADLKVKQYCFIRIRLYLLLWEN